MSGDEFDNGGWMRCGLVRVHPKPCVKCLTLTTWYVKNQDAVDVHLCPKCQDKIGASE